MSLNRETLIALTADVASAFVSNNVVQVDDLDTIIQRVARALSAVSATEVAPDPRQPAVSIRSAVSEHSVTCLDCGKVMKSLKQHLRLAHGLTPDEYRKRWKLKSDAVIVAPSYSAKRQQIAYDHSLGKKGAT